MSWGEKNRMDWAACFLVPLSGWRFGQGLLRLATRHILYSGVQSIDAQIWTHVRISRRRSFRSQVAKEICSFIWSNGLFLFWKMVECAPAHTHTTPGTWTRASVRVSVLARTLPAHMRKKNIKNITYVQNPVIYFWKCPLLALSITALYALVKQNTRA